MSGGLLLLALLALGSAVVVGAKLPRTWLVPALAGSAATLGASLVGDPS